MIYLAAYLLMTLGAFGLVVLLEAKGYASESVDDFNGLWKRNPLAAGAMVVFLLSLAGIPPTAGFVAKWYVFSAAVSAGQFGLAIIGVLTSVVSVFFYLRIVVMMYMTDKGEAPAVPAVPRPALAALSLSAIALFYLGVLPTRLLDLAARSVAGMF